MTEKWVQGQHFLSWHNPTERKKNELKVSISSPGIILQDEKQEGHDGPEVAHLYIGPPNPHPPTPQRCRANLTQGLLFAQTW
jgi:hypothetical protein